MSANSAQSAKSANSATSAKSALGKVGDWLADSGLEENHWIAHTILVVVVLFVVSGLIWANAALLDEATSGFGRVIPSGQVQVIQNLEGGILAELLVKDGDLVEKDQVVAKLDPTRFTASLRENRAKYLALLAAESRLRAESDGTALRFSAELKTRPDLARVESELHGARRRTLEESVAALRRSLALAQREMEMTEPVVQRGGVSEVELLRLRRQVNELAGTIEERRNRFRAEARADLNRVLSELDGLRETAVAATDRVERSTLRAPVRGIVKKIYQRTLGAVIPPGGDLMDIVPLDDTLLVEARIRPVDIGFLHVGQPAKVKITAFDYAIYGNLPAKVEYISADAIDDPKEAKGESYYRVLVRTERNFLDGRKGRLEIIPGMNASVDVLTGSRTVLTYLLKPFIKVQETALRER